MLVIRPYTAADREACLPIFRSNMPTFFTLSEEVDFERWLDQMDGVLPAPPGDVVQYSVVEVAGIVRGCGGWGIRAGERHATLIWGMVDRAHHGRGLGEALTQHRIEAFEAAYPGWPLRIDTSQHTAPFYARFGFEAQRVTPDGYAPGLDRWDMERPGAHPKH